MDFIASSFSMVFGEVAYLFSTLSVLATYVHDNHDRDKMHPRVTHIDSILELCISSSSASPWAIHQLKNSMQIIKIIHKSDMQLELEFLNGTFHLLSGKTVVEYQNIIYMIQKNSSSCNLGIRCDYEAWCASSECV